MNFFKQLLAPFLVVALLVVLFVIALFYTPPGKDWLDVLTGLLGPCIAVAGIYFSFKQHQIAKLEYKARILPVTHENFRSLAKPFTEIQASIVANKSWEYIRTKSITLIDIDIRLAGFIFGKKEGERLQEIVQSIARELGQPKPNHKNVFNHCQEGLRFLETLTFNQIEGL